MSHPTINPHLKTFKDWFTTFVCGIFMGTADIVPGISGGAMALLLGIYEDLLKSISSFNLKAFSYLFRFRFRDFFNRVGWEFLLALLSGIACVFILLAQVFTYILNDEIYRIYLYSVFLGLISAAIVFCARQVKGGWRQLHFVLLSIAVVVSFVLTSSDLKPKETAPLFNVQLPTDKVPFFTKKNILNYYYDSHILTDVPAPTLSAMIAKGVIDKETPVYSQSEQKNGPAGQFVDGNYHQGINLWLVMCGAIAIMAMLMPGISGSYMLTILGAYPIAIGAVADFIQGITKGIFEMDAFMVMISLAIGIIAGALCFSHVVKWLLAHYHNNTVAVLTGVMLGALHTVWPYRSYEYVLLPLKLEKGPHLEVVNSIMPTIASPVFWIASACTVVGFCFVLTIEYVAHRHKRSTAHI